MIPQLFSLEPSMVHHSSWTEGLSLRFWWWSKHYKENPNHRNAQACGGFLLCPSTLHNAVIQSVLNCFFTDFLSWTISSFGTKMKAISFTLPAQNWVLLNQLEKKEFSRRLSSTWWTDLFWVLTFTQNASGSFFVHIQWRTSWKSCPVIEFHSLNLSGGSYLFMNSHWWQATICPKQIGNHRCQLLLEDPEMFAGQLWDTQALQQD